MINNYDETILATYYNLNTGEPLPFNVDDLYLFDEIQIYMEIKQDEKDLQLENEKAGIIANY